LFFLFSLSDYYALVCKVEKLRYRQREEESKEEIEATGGIKLVNSNQKKSRGRKKANERGLKATRRTPATHWWNQTIKARRQLWATEHYTLHTTH